MFVLVLHCLFTSRVCIFTFFNVCIPNFRFVYKHWFVYLHFQCLYTKFSPCLQTLLCLFTFSNVCIPIFRLVYKHRFVYLHFLMFVYRISALFTNTGLFIYVFQCLYTEFPLCLQTLLCLFTFSNVCIPNFRLVYKHCFVYLRFPMFVCKVSALFTNIGLFIYIFCVCLLLECKQTCCRLVARFLEICFRWLVK